MLQLSSTLRGRVERIARPDPLRGGTMIAIIDVGPHQLSVDRPQPDAGAPAGARKMLGCSASSTHEFDL
jgi:hypothetical protein